MHDYEWVVKYVDDDHLWSVDLGSVPLSHVLDQFKRAALAGAVAGREVLGMWLITYGPRQPRIAALFGRIPPFIESCVTSRTKQRGACHKEKPRQEVARRG